MAAEFYSPADQLIYKDNQFIPQEQYRLSYTPPDEGEEEVTQGSGIPYTNAFTNSGGGDNYYPGPTKNLIRDFETATTDRQAQLNAGEINTLPGMNQPQSYEDIMDKGYRTTGRVMPGIIGLMNKFGIQNFAGLPQADQAFIASQTGYRGPTVFGENTGGHNVDIFGKNIESLAGNYAESVRKDYTHLGKTLGEGGKIFKKYNKAGDLEWDEETGMFTGTNAADANKMTKMLRTRFKFRKNQMNEQGNIESDLARRHQAEAAFARRGGDEGADPSKGKQFALDKARVDKAYAEETGKDSPYSGGAHRADESGSTYTDPFDPGGGEKEGGFIDGSNRRVGFQGGGWSPGVGRDERGYKSDHPSFEGGGNNEPEKKKKLNIVPVIGTKESDLGYQYPTGVFGFDASTPLGRLKAKMNLKNYVLGDDVEPQIDYTKNIGNFNLAATTDLDNYNLSATYDKGPFFAKATTDNMGNTNFNVGARWEWADGGLVSIL